MTQLQESPRPAHHENGDRKTTVAQNLSRRRVLSCTDSDPSIEPCSSQPLRDLAHKPNNGPIVLDR